MKLPLYTGVEQYVQDANDANRLKSLKTLLERKHFRDLKARKAAARGIEEAESAIAEEVAVASVSHPTKILHSLLNQITFNIVSFIYSAFVATYAIATADDRIFTNGKCSSI